jgi:hypothetical protein
MGSVLERVALAGLSRWWLGPLLGSTGGWCWEFGDVSGVPGGPVGRWLAVLCLVSLHQVGFGSCSLQVVVACGEGVGVGGRRVVGEGL